jgi:hypothetical protein
MPELGANLSANLWRTEAAMFPNLVAEGWHAVFLTSSFDLFVAVLHVNRLDIEGLG